MPNSQIDQRDREAFEAWQESVGDWREGGLDAWLAALRYARGGDMVMVPVKPPIGLLVSIAMRLDHSFGMNMPTLTKDGFVNETDEEWYQRQRVLITDAGRAYDEIVGEGFYAPDKEQWYVGHLAPEWNVTLDAAQGEKEKP